MPDTIRLYIVSLDEMYYIYNFLFWVDLIVS